MSRTAPRGLNPQRHHQDAHRLAEDHAVVRQGLRLILDGEPDLVVVGEADDSTTAARVVLVS
jgi:DNA-binding NarL/FixJ family response regulator